MNFKPISGAAARALAGAALFAALGALAPSHAAGADKTVAAGRERLETLSPQGEHGKFTCPMHPEIHRHEPGKCPVCKMKLVKTKPKNV